MKCKTCGCVNPDNAQYCKQCGTLLNPSLENGLDAYSDPKSNCNTMSIVGFLSSITCVLLILVPYQWILSVAGLVMCLIAKKQIKTDGKKGNDLATAGIIISIIGGCVNILVYNGWYFNQFIRF